MEEIQPIAENSIPIPEGKIYSDKVIWGATFVGGPLAAGYILANNFNVFKDAENARKTWIYTGLVCFGLGIALYLLRNVEKFPNFVIPVIYTSAAYAFMQATQKNKIREHIDAGGKKKSIGNVILVSILSLLISIVLLITPFVLTDKTLMASSKDYGVQNSTVYFKKGTIEETQVDNIADVLDSANYFNVDFKTAVYIDKEADNYIIMIPVKEDAWDDGEVILWFEELRKEIQIDFPNNHIVLDLCIDFDTSKRRIE